MKFDDEVQSQNMPFSKTGGYIMKDLTLVRLEEELYKSIISLEARYNEKR